VALGKENQMEKTDGGATSPLKRGVMREIELGMSNFDCEIEDGFEEALRKEPNKVFGRHAGWNFNGLVHFDGEQFVERVHVYGSMQEEIKADTLKDLMDEVNNEYGWD